MGTLHIKELTGRYHLPRSRHDQRGRLDRLLERVLSDHLPQALSLAGVSPREEVCVRSLHSLVRLPLSASDDELIRAWAAALTQALTDAIRGEESSRVVRYPTRISALFDFARGVATGDHGRAWAWRQVGLAEIGTRVSSAEAREALIRALIGEPSAIVPVLVALAREARMVLLWRALRPIEREALVEASARSVGAPYPPEPASDLGALRLPAPRADEVETSDRERASRLVERSALARAALDAPGAFLETRPERIALASLVILEADPGLALRGEETYARRVRAVGVALSASAGPSHAEASDLTPLEHRDRIASTGPAESPREGVASFPEEEAASPSAAPRPARRPSDDSPDTEESGEHPSPPRVLRRTASTSMGGLLFLVGVMDDLELPLEIAASPISARRTFRFAVHAIARTLTGLDPADPGVLAFAGLGPEEEPPSESEDPLSDEEREQVEEWARRIAAEVEERIGDEKRRGAALMDWFMRRRATLHCDVGWIEARFSTADVSTAIRRAGLDLDPGFVPWLGIVLRFVYE